MVKRSDFMVLPTTGEDGVVGEVRWERDDVSQYHAQDDCTVIMRRHTNLRLTVNLPLPAFEALLFAEPAPAAADDYTAAAVRLAEATTAYWKTTEPENAAVAYRAYNAARDAFIPLYRERNR